MFLVFVFCFVWVIHCCITDHPQKVLKPITKWLIAHSSAIWAGLTWAVLLLTVAHEAASSWQTGWRLSSAGTQDGWDSLSFLVFSGPLPCQVACPHDFSSREAGLLTWYLRAPPIHKNRNWQVFLGLSLDLAHYFYTQFRTIHRYTQIQEEVGVGTT